jgi:hypothetical protein
VSVPVLFAVDEDARLLSAAVGEGSVAIRLVHDLVSGP